MFFNFPFPLLPLNVIRADGVTIEDTRTAPTPHEVAMHLREGDHDAQQAAFDLEAEEERRKERIEELESQAEQVREACQYLL